VGENVGGYISIYRNNGPDACGKGVIISYHFTHSRRPMFTENAVIRFKCPNCARYYEVSQVLKHIPLLCKGCGQRIDVPESSSEPEPAAPVVSESLNHSVHKHQPVSVPLATGTSPAVQPPEIERPPVTPTTEGSLAHEEAHPTVDAQKAESTAANTHTDRIEVSESISRKKPLPILVDAMIGLLLLLIGGLLGEFLTKRSTSDVWKEAGSAPKFPPIDLLLWLAPPTMLILIYYLLITRRKSLGAWLQQRREKLS
jgi:hypothetical protein